MRADPGHGVDGAQVVRLVQRCQFAESVQPLKDVIGDPHRVAELRPAVNHAVAGADQVMALQPFLEPAQRPVQGLIMPIGLR